MMAQQSGQRSHHQRQAPGPSSGQPDGIVRSYDAQGWLLRSAVYRDGRLDGAEVLFGAPGATLCTLPLALAGALEHGDLSPKLRLALAERQIALPDDAAVTVVASEREYLISAIDQSYTLCVIDGELAVAAGRVIRSTRFEDGMIVARSHSQGGRLEGERAAYAPPGEPLFALALDFQADLDSGNLKRLQPAFKLHGYTLADDALIALELAGSEWRISQSDGMRSVLRTGDQLTVYPGRVVQRAIFVDGELVETAHYQAGRLDGTVTIYRPLGSVLFELDLGLRAALDAGQIEVLGRRFQQRGYALHSDARLVTVTEDSEWFIAQAGPSYTIRRSATGLTAFRGRVISQSSYRHGALDGPTTLYDEQAMLAQQLGYCRGQLDGPMTLYSAGLKQTLITFQDGQKHGPMIAYDERGRETMVSQYCADQLDGELCVYSEGRLQALVMYRGGKQHGRSIAYHASGHEHLVAAYTNGLLDDESVLYNEVGQVLKTSQYRDGKLEGTVIEYYPSGAVRTHATYHDDRLDGIVYLYDEQGRLKEKTHYRNGEPVGKPEHRSWLDIFTQR